MTLPRILDGNRRRLFLRLVGNGVAQAVVAVLSVLLIRNGFDALSGSTGSTAIEAVVVPGIALAAVAAVMAGLRILERTDAERMAQDYVLALRSRLFDRVVSATAARARPHSHGPLMLRFASDLTAVRQWVGEGLSRLVAAGIAAFGAAAAIVYLDPWLGLGVAAAFTLPAAAALRLGSSFRTATTAVRRKRGGLSAAVSDRLLRAQVLVAFGSVTRERRRIGKRGRELATATIARARLGGALRALPDFGIAVATGVVLAVGSYEIVAGRATQGTLVAAIAVLGILARPIRDVARTYEYWNNYQVARRMIVKLLREEGVPRGKQAPLLATGAGRLVFDQVVVPGALRQLSATAEPGSIVALVGPSGAGKSTLLNLASGVLAPAAGQVQLDDRDIAGATASSRREAIGILSADLPLLNGSIRRNLCYRRPEATAAELERVTALCELDAHVASLPDGLDTRVGEAGRGIPNGLRQRVALARALLPWPRLLLIDQPEALLDPPGRKALARILAQRDSTVVLVTNDLTFIRMAEVVWYLEDGALVESGEPQVLLSRPSRAAQFLGLPVRQMPGLASPAVGRPA